MPKLGEYLSKQRPTSVKKSLEKKPRDSKEETAKKKAGIKKFLSKNVSPPKSKGKTLGKNRPSGVVETGSVMSEHTEMYKDFPESQADTGSVAG